MNRASRRLSRFRALVERREKPNGCMYEDTYKVLATFLEFESYWMSPAQIALAVGSARGGLFKSPIKGFSVFLRYFSLCGKP
jgi:hypothetical protein